MKASDFDLLNDVKAVAELCSKHGSHLFQFRDMKPFCKECKREDKQAQDEQIAKDGTNAYLKRTSFGWLDSLSIFADDTVRANRFENYTEVDDETSKNKQMARRITKEYLEGKVFNTFISGKAGTGKTFLSMSILRAINENSMPYKKCLFISVDELMRLIKDSISNKESPYTEKAMVDRLTKADILVLDDCGAETGAIGSGKAATDYTTKILYAIMNGRMNKSTILTTNLSSRELSKMYDQKLLSRMLKGSEGNVIKFESTADKRPFTKQQTLEF